MAVLGSAAFAIMALGQPVKFVTSGAPVEPTWAGLAVAGSLAGLAMASLSYMAGALLLRPPVDQKGWDRIAAGSLTAGLAGFAVCAFASGAALLAALIAFGASALHQSGAGMVTPVGIGLMGAGVVVAVNLWRRREPWTALGHVLWGLFGVVALLAGAPMLVEAGTVDDLKTLSLRYNLFVVFYPVIWLAYTGLALALVYAAVRALRFSFEPAAMAAQKILDENPPSHVGARANGFTPQSEMRNKAA